MNQYEFDAQIARARADAVTASRSRIEAIRDCPEGVRTPRMANHLAFQTDIEPTAAREAMAALPAENAVARDREAAAAGWAKAAARSNAGKGCGR